jgi:hypothetical protein
VNGRRGTREDGEGWTSVKSRKSLGQEDGDRGHRNGERDKDRYQKDSDVDNTESTSRRIGIGRGRFDQPWSREEPGAKDGEGTKTGARGQGWRDRERDRDREIGNGTEVAGLKRIQNGWTRPRRQKRSKLILRKTSSDGKSA